MGRAVAGSPLREQETRRRIEGEASLEARRPGRSDECGRHGVRVERLLWIRPRDAAECLWVLEQTLRSGECSIVIGWPGRVVAREAVRRLQLAAEAGRGLGCLMLSSAAAGRASAAALRLKVHRRGRDLEVEVLKRRGGWALPPQRLSRGPAGGGRGPGDEKGRHGNSAAAACSGKATGG